MMKGVGTAPDVFIGRFRTACPKKEGTMDPEVILVCDDSGMVRGVLNPLRNTCVPDEQIAEVERQIPSDWYVERRTIRSAAGFLAWMKEKGISR